MAAESFLFSGRNEGLVPQSRSLHTVSVSFSSNKSSSSASRHHLFISMQQQNRLGLYITIPLYFCILGIVAWISYRRIQRMQSDGVADQLTSHYLGGRAFGEITIAGTVFASLFSGYTVIGIPNEAFRRGFYAFRWMPSTAYIAMGYIGTGVRLRKASVVRNHHTPVDFITDRFRSHLLRYSIMTIQVLASLIYLAAQVNALKSTFNAMFGFDPDDVWPVIIIMAIILAFEWAGGLAVIGKKADFIFMLVYFMRTLKTHKTSLSFLHFCYYSLVG